MVAALKTFPADLVWAAACHAQRINGEYVKTSSTDACKKPLNRLIMQSALSSPQTLTVEDKENGRNARIFFQGYTFRILRGDLLTSFETTALMLADKDEIQEAYDIAVICSLPSVFMREQEKQKINDLLLQATGGNVATKGQRVEIEMQVLRSIYSMKWNTHFIAGLTNADQSIYFAFSKNIAVGKKVKIKGTVKDFKNNTTRLSRVKLLSLEGSHEVI